MLSPSEVLGLHVSEGVAELVDDDDVGDEVSEASGEELPQPTRAVPSSTKKHAAPLLGHAALSGQAPT